MHRYSADNSIVYTAEDIALFRESPFASWMERLTLENPDHGISPDRPLRPTQSASDVAGARSAVLDTGEILQIGWQDFTLMESPEDYCEPTASNTVVSWGPGVVEIESHDDEVQRRLSTIQAMRDGAEFIVQAQLAVGPLADRIKLLMRSIGPSELGDYHYLPCDSALDTTAKKTFNLCFAADLLHSIQGRLPPQMLIFRDGMEMEALETEEHIYHYSAVKQRFMSEQSAFRKHRMPDPGDSTHFGRWSACANDVLKRRALITQGRTVARLEDTEEQEVQQDSDGLSEVLPIAAQNNTAITVEPTRTDGGGEQSATAVDSPEEPAETGLVSRLNQALESGARSARSAVAVALESEPPPFSNTLDTRAGLASYD